MTSRSVALLTIFSLAACSSGARQPAVLPNVPSDAAARGATPDYVSAASKGMSVRITGPTNVTKTAGLRVTDAGCRSTLMTAQCVVTIPGLAACPTMKACYTADVAVYDAYDAAKNTIPHKAHELSAVSGLKFSIAAGQTMIPLVLDGVPKSVTFIPSKKTALTGSQSGGFVAPKCHLAPQTVSIVGVDAGGNYIVGPGAPKTSLTSDDSAQLSIKRGKSTEPNVYILSPPKSPLYAYGGHTVTLTAKATPEEQSLGRTVTANVKVRYSGDICGIFTEFNVPSGASSQPAGIINGPDGALWFTEAAANKIGRVTTTGSFTEFGGLSLGATPSLLAVGPDRNVWFAELGSSKIAKITTNGTIAEYPTLTAAAQPVSVAAGPDGRIWFIEAEANKVGVVTTVGTSMHEYTIPTAASRAQAIVTGPDGNLWFPENHGNKIAQITTTGTISETAIPAAGSAPVGIVVGSDRELWFTEETGNNIGRVQTSLLSTSVNSEFPLPESGSNPFLVALGPDGNVWFTEFAGNRIASITPGGAITEYSVPTGSSVPYGLSAGPDGAIWFAEAATGKIGRLR